MNAAERYRRAGAIFTQAMDLGADERGPFLDESCGDDDELRAAVTRLMEAEAQVDGTGHGIGLSLLEESLVRGQVIGDYRILRVLGQGGMGTVYLGEQESPSRRVAIKVIRRGAASRDLIRRFRHEAEILGRLTHPGIAHIYDAGTYDDGEGGRPYFAMEYIEGVPLTTYAATSIPDMRERLGLFASICDAVQHAHQKGVIHRDLKPDNILVTAAGHPKILDFGVARVTDGDLRATTIRTSPGQLVGTLSYMSPEQIGGSVGELDTRSDVYALGVVLFELLSGRLPYGTEHPSIPELIRAIHEGRGTRLSSIDSRFRGDVETIVATATENDPDRRYDSAAALAADVRRYLNDEPIAARPASRMYRMRLFTRRHRALVIGLTTAMVAIVGGALASLEFGLDAQRHSATSERARYRLSIESAALRQMLGDGRSSRRVLRAAPTAHRNWEWDYLWAQAPAIVPDAEDRPLQVPTRVAFRDDGTAVAAVLLEDGVAAYDVTTGRRLAFLGLEDPSSECFNLSPDGAFLVAVARRADEVRVVPIDDAGPPRTAPAGGLAASVRPVVDETGSIVVSLADGDDEVRIIDLATGTQRTIAQAPVDGRLSSLDQRGTRVASVSQRQGRTELAVIDIDSGRTLAERTWSADGVFSRWRSWAPAWSPADALLAVRGNASEVWVLDAGTLDTRVVVPVNLVDEIRHTSALGCALASEALLYVSDRDGTLWRVDLPSGNTTRIADAGRCASLAASEDGHRLLVSNLGSARLIDMRYGPGCTELAGHGSYAYMHAWSGDGTILATSAWDYTVRLWDGLSGAALGTIRGWTGEEPCGLVFDGERTLEMLFTHDGLAQDRLLRARLDLATGAVDVDRVGTTAEYLHEAPADMRLNSRGVFVATASGTAGDFNVVSRDGRRAAFPVLRGDGYQVAGTTVIDRTTGAVIWTSDAVVDAVLGLNHDGTRVVCGYRNGRVESFDLRTGTRLASRGVHDDAIYSVQFSPDETRIVSAGIDGVRILEGETLTPLLHFQDADDYVRGASFSPDGTRVATVSGDSVVRLYDAVDRDERRRQIRALDRQRASMAKIVDELLREHGDEAAVWSALHSGSRYSAEERSAGRYVLTQRALARLTEPLPRP